MGPLLMTGLACFGAAVGIGLLAAGVSPPVGPPARVASYQVTAQSLSLILAAFIEGVAVIAVVVGLLAIEVGLVSDPSDGIFAAGPALIGALIGLGLVLTHASVIDAGTALICAMFIVGIGILGAVVAGLAWFIAGPVAVAPATWPFAVLGLISGTSALAIGVTGGRGVRAIPDTDEPGLRAYQSLQIARSMPFQLAAIGASVVAIFLVMLG